MSLSEIVSMIDSAGVTAYYNKSPDGTTLPYISYTAFRVSQLDADNKVYSSWYEVRAELYCDGKTETETHLQNLIDVLDANECPYTTEEVILDSEQTIETIITFNA